MNRFADWFASRAGIWQTGIIVVGWSIAATVWTFLDPSLFRTMAVLTIYSAITQPILAYVAVRSSDKADRDLAALRLEEDHIDALASQILQGLQKENS